MLFKGFLPNVNHIQKVNENDNKDFTKDIVFYNESFSGGVFRKKAEATVNELSPYNLLRGLEIDTDSKVYVKLASDMPTCADVFAEAMAEKPMGSEILIKQLNKVAEMISEVTSVSPNSEEFEAIISASKGKINVQKLKAIFKNIEDFEKANSGTDFITRLIMELTTRIKADRTPLKAKVYDAIDSRNLEAIEYEDMTTTSMNWVTDGGDVEKMLSDMDAVHRITAFFELLIPLLNIKGFEYIKYEGNNVYAYFKAGLDLINGLLNIKLPEANFKEYVAIINDIGAKIVLPEIELFTTKYAKSIYFPTIQTFYVSLLSLYSLKVISSTITSVEKKEEIAKKEEETKKVEMAKEVTAKQVNSSVKAIEDLNQSGFFESKKIFHATPKRPYGPMEKKMIPQIKEFVSTLGLIKDVDETWKMEEKFDKILTDSIKNFQGSIQIDGKTLTPDGKIGPNTRTAMLAYLEALKMKTGVVASTDVKKK